MASGVSLCLIPGLVIFLFEEARRIDEAFRRMHPGVLLLALGMVGAGWLCHSLRVWLGLWALGRRCPWKEAFTAAMAMEFGVSATPGGVGGGILKVAILRRIGVPVGESLGLIAADWLFDGLFFLLTGVLGAYVALRESLWLDMLRSASIRHISGSLLGIAVAVIVIVLMAGLWAKRVWQGYGKDSVGGSAAGDIEWARGKLLRLRDTLRLGWAALPRLAKSRRPVIPGFIVLAMVQGGCRFGVLPILVHSLNPDLNIIPLIPLQALLWALSLALVAPGGGGGVEILSLIFLQAVLPPGFVSVTVLSWRLLTYHMPLVVGAFVVLPSLWIKR